MERLELDDVDVLRSIAARPGNAAGTLSCGGPPPICASKPMLLNACVWPGPARPTGMDCADALGNDKAAPASVAAL